MLIKPLLRIDRLFYLPLLTLISLLLGCGGGNSNKTQPQPQPQQTPPTKVVEKPHEKCSVIVTGDNAGVSYKLLSESDYKGDLKFNCSYDKENQPTAQQYYLINGVPSLNIVDLHRTVKLTNNCTLNDSVFTETITVTFNYKSGIVKSNFDSSLKGKSSCESKYKTPLATTISDHKSIFSLFEGWGTDVSEANKTKSGLIETDCPQEPPVNTEVPTCKRVINEEYTITDDTGKVHTVEKKVSY